MRSTRQRCRLGRTARTLLTAAALGLAAATFAPAGQAAWLGLQDGDYAVTLSCDFSSVIACPASIGGTLSMAGGETTAMNFTVNGQLFAGDPLDTLVDTATLDFESTTLQLAPNAFLSLRLITAGQFNLDPAVDRSPALARPHEHERLRSRLPSPAG